MGWSKVWMRYLWSLWTSAIELISYMCGKYFISNTVFEVVFHCHILNSVMMECQLIYIHIYLCFTWLCCVYCNPLLRNYTCLAVVYSPRTFLFLYSWVYAFVYVVYRYDIFSRTRAFHLYAWILLNAISLTYAPLREKGGRVASYYGHQLYLGLSL